MITSEILYFKGFIVFLNHENFKASLLQGAD